MIHVTEPVTEDYLYICIRQSIFVSRWQGSSLIGLENVEFQFIPAMDRRIFLKISAAGLTAMATESLLELPAVAAAKNEITKHNTPNKMKKIMIIDGGPRRNMNTAGMLHAFAEGAKSLGEDVEVKTVRLYELDYKGCMSCMACKIKGRASNICKFKDALTPILEEISQADGLALGSPIYFGEVTGQMRTFLERLSFPWLSYNDYNLTAPKRMPVALIETMNGTPERNNSNGYGSMEHCIATALGRPERLVAYNTCQVKDYSRYELAGFSEEAKHEWREEHWEKDLQKAFDAGKKMVESLLR